MLFSALFRRNISSLDDLDLIDLVKKNDRRAAGELFRRYAALVMGLCLKYMKNQMIAEDMMMDIFEKLPQKIQKNEIQNFKSWLFSVTRNSCLMELRKKKRDTSDIDNALLYTTDNSSINLELVFAKEDKLNELEDALSNIKDDQKEALKLFYLENKSYDEVGAIMKTSIKKVKSLIQNGKRNLKLKLEKENEF